MANYNLQLDGNWLFHFGDFDRKAHMEGWEYHASSKAGGALSHLENFTDESLWREISLPHDWLTELPIDGDADATSGCKKRETAWYKKTFSLGEEDVESAELVFDGVLGNSTVFVNGVLAGRNFSGYNRFSVEIGDYLLPSALNEVAVFVDARRHEGWWYEGAGIYRPVCLKLRPETRLLPEDCFVHTVGNSVFANLRFTGEGEIAVSLKNCEGQVVASAKTFGKELADLELKVNSPARWSPETPNLYTLSVDYLKGGERLDNADFSVGFRDIQWIANSGMHLDGKKYRIKGICAHQDHAGLGAAVCEDVEEYRILRLKTLGANAYRCAHHAPSETLLDICDRLGMFVMVENRHFNTNEDTMKQLDALVKLSRNHPSVFMYCMFNEEPWQAEERGKRIVAKLRERVQMLDTTRVVTAAQNDGVLLHHNASEALDVVGMNYNLSAYETCHDLLPEKVILGTENSPTFATRGIAKTDRTLQVFSDDGREYPADFSQPLYETMECVKKHPFVAGCFVWSGFDHRGEPNPFGYPSVLSHWGFLDCCGFDKNIAHWLRSYYLDEPFLELATFSEKTDRAVAFTNAEGGELFADGVSLGRVRAEHNKLEWPLPENFRELTVVAEINGREIRDSYRKPDKRERISVTEVNPAANPKVRILNICITDKNNLPILSENGTVRVKGRVLGVGNGDPNGHHLDRANEVNLFGGMAQIITERDGKTVISYDNLPDVVLLPKKP